MSQLVSTTVIPGQRSGEYTMTRDIPTMTNKNTPLKRNTSRLAYNQVTYAVNHNSSDVGQIL